MSNHPYYPHKQWVQLSDNSFSIVVNLLLLIGGPAYPAIWNAGLFHPVQVLR